MSNRKMSLKASCILRYGLIGFAGLAVLLFLGLAVFTVPAPSAETATTVSGWVAGVVD